MEGPVRQAIWQGLIAEPETGVIVLARDGRVLYCNDQAVTIFRPDSDDTAADVIGRTMSEILPADYVRDRMAALQRIAADGVSRILRTVWRGRQIVSWVHYIPPQPGEEDGGRFLSITRYHSGSIDDLLTGDDPPEMIPSSINELGPLDVLSTRELEVLAMLGNGLDSAAIARRLHRSRSTIESHRNAIAAKLDASDRATLIDIAQRAGLTLDDARRARTTFDPTMPPTIEIDRETTQASLREAPPTFDLSMLVSDPTVGVSVMTENGDVIYCNEQLARLHASPEMSSASRFIGRNIREWTVPSRVEQRLKLFRDITADGKPRLERGLWRGRQQVMWYYALGPEPAADDDAEVPRILILTRVVSGQIDLPGASPDQFEVAESTTGDLGPLAALTPREIEVLALIGTGKTVSEIASIRGRSIKTVEHHRTALGRKLGKVRRPELIRFAYQAGLTLRDAQVERVDPAESR